VRDFAISCRGRISQGKGSGNENELTDPKVRVCSALPMTGSDSPEIARNSVKDQGGIATELTARRERHAVAGLVAARA
jgi:hypothetical protein